MEIAIRAQLPLFPENDPGALGALLERLAGDRAQVREIAARGCAVARREFGFDRMLERWKQTLRQLAERHSSVS
jgi:glycosyltransferase involved in cell wall biosynthesis